MTKYKALTLNLIDFQKDLFTKVQAKALDNTYIYIIQILNLVIQEKHVTVIFTSPANRLSSLATSTCLSKLLVKLKRIIPGRGQCE